MSVISGRFRWRVVDIVVASAIGVAAGLVFFSWNIIYGLVTVPIAALTPGLQAITYGIWLFAGVLGGLIIRKPGAAVFVEIVATLVSALIGTQWGLLITLEAGLVQGLGAEIVFALFLYRNWRPFVAVLAGAAAGLAMAMNDWLLTHPGADIPYVTVYTISAVVSGAVLAGLGSWLLARALARTGGLSRFESGRDTAQRV